MAPGAPVSLFPFPKKGGWSAGRRQGVGETPLAGLARPHCAPCEGARPSGKRGGASRRSTARRKSALEANLHRAKAIWNIILCRCRCQAGRSDKKSPASLPGFSLFVGAAIAGPSGRLFLGGGFRLRFLGRLRPTPRALGERAFDLLDRFGLGDFLHRRDFARQPVERGFVKLPLGIELLRLGIRPFSGVTSYLHSFQVVSQNLRKF